MVPSCLLFQYVFPMIKKVYIRRKDGLHHVRKATNGIPPRHFSQTNQKACSLFRLDGQGRQQSLTSEMKLPPESDTESIADYADGNDGGERLE